MTPPNVFVVCVHDAHPGTAGEVRHVLDGLRPYVGACVSAGVIPQPRGREWPAGATRDDFVALVRRHTSEVLLHGLTHHRPAALSPLSRLIGGADEFAALSADEAQRRLACGLVTLRDYFGPGTTVTGVLPPGWRAGRIPHAMPAAGLRFLVGMARLRTESGPAVPLATWSWDAGRVAGLGHLLDLTGTVLSWRRGAVPSIAIHPADVRRGFLPRAVGLVRSFLRAGLRPALYRDLCGGSPGG